VSQEGFDEKMQCSAKQSNAEEEREVFTERHVQSDLMEAIFVVKTRRAIQYSSKMR
jgi:hypothetical protein